MKPWYWISHVLFDEGFRRWDATRRSLGDVTLLQVLPRVICVLGVAAAIPVLSRNVAKLPSFGAMQVRLDDFVASQGAPTAAYVVGLPSMVVSVAVSFYLTPRLWPVMYAAPTWCLTQATFMAIVVAVFTELQRLTQPVWPF